MGLRTKIVIFLVAAAALVIGSLAGRSLQRQKELVEGQARLRGLEVLRALSIPCSAAMANQADWELDALLDRFARTEGRDLDLRWVGIVDDQARILAHTDPEYFGRQADDGFTRRAIAASAPLSEQLDDPADPSLLLSMPVVTGELGRGIRWGTMTARISLERLETQVSAAQQETFFAASIGIILTALGLWFVLSRLVVRPVERLSTTARRISEGDLTARAGLPEARDELSVMGAAFDEMAARIQGATRSLEAQVAERTQRLAESNTRLEETNRRLEQLVQELDKIARTDGLTGLLNHRSIKEHLIFEFARSRRVAHPLSVIMIDVDHFKAFNDHHGHPAGDVVLTEVAMTLKQQLRSTDLVARYGGEEFCVVLLDTTAEGAGLAAEKLRAAIAGRSFPGEAQSQPGGSLTISAGIASYPGDAESADDLVAKADVALYEAKRKGRDQVVAWSEELAA